MDNKDESSDPLLWLLTILILSCSLLVFPIFILIGIFNKIRKSIGAYENFVKVRQSIFKTLSNFLEGFEKFTSGDW